MAERVLTSLVTKVIEILATDAYKEIKSFWDAKNDLKKLENTIKMIQARVRDAERRQEDDNGDLIKQWLRRLKQLLYRADDLFDEVLTRDRQKQRVESNTLKEVGILLSGSRLLINSRKLAHDIKSIRKELDAIKSDMDCLNLRVILPEELLVPFNPLMKKRETASFVLKEEIIGRDNDVSMILGLLFDPIYDVEKVTVIPIVGFGGIGKTTLAQLVFNDESVQKHFDRIKWACIPEVGNQRVIIEQVHKAFTSVKSSDLSLDEVKLGIRKTISDVKYLLVLDDIWDESRDRWLDLLSLLKCGRVGSKIIVTTRSDEVAKIVGTIPKPYKLGLLTEEESWNLFKRLAFRSGQEESNPSLVQIGKEIVGRCGNVPLAIRVIGNLLYSKDSEEKWRIFKDDQLPKAKLLEDGNIMPVLKLSYDNLSPVLKECFVYCSLFPKDYEFNKADLVHLWMAQGYFEPSNRDIGAQYFSELLGRNFFQDSQEDGRGNVKMCKMHDLVHDLAQHIADDEYMLLGGKSLLHITDGLIHVNLDGREDPPSLSVAKKMRSLLGFFDRTQANSYELILRFRSLRVLSLENRGIETLPSSIEKLIHLRYLNLAGNRIKCLPECATKLENLQTLNLDDCKDLKKLPKGFKKLANLRHLVIDWDSLTDLPPGFGEMTSLHELHRFDIRKAENTSIDSLPALNLRGDLIIRFHEWRRNAVMEAQRANLKGNQQLSFLSLKFQLEGEQATLDSCGIDEMLTCLQLPRNLKYLEFDGYKGVKMPLRWLDGLSTLVSVRISGCDNCRVLPHLGKLLHLKFLYIGFLEALEYMEDETGIWVDNDYLPFLEILELVDLPQLKGWIRPSNDNDEQRQLLFPRLLQMKLTGCRDLMSMPRAPKLESLEVKRINGKLLKSILTSLCDHEASSSSSLKRMKIYQIQAELESLSISSSLCKLITLEISFCYQLQSLMFESPNSIQHLDIRWCKNLRNISEGLQHLSNLEKLEIRSCDELDEEEQEDRKATKSWQALTSLCMLHLLDIPKLTKLPEGIACLTTLHRLSISKLMNLTALPEKIGNLSQLHDLSVTYCPKLESLPPSLQDLTSLQKLLIEGCPKVANIHVEGCSELAKMFKKPDGQDGNVNQHARKGRFTMVRCKFLFIQLIILLILGYLGFSLYNG